jgi:hypothetical protein
MGGRPGFIVRKSTATTTIPAVGPIQPGMCSCSVRIFSCQSSSVCAFHIHGTVHRYVFGSYPQATPNCQTHRIITANTTNCIYVSYAPEDGQASPKHVEH